MVTVYSKNECILCDRTKKLLVENNLPFEEVNIEERPGAKDALRDMGYRSVPVVSTPEETWVGYQPDKIKALRAS